MIETTGIIVLNFPERTTHLSQNPDGLVLAWKDCPVFRVGDEGTPWVGERAGVVCRSAAPPDFRKTLVDLSIHVPVLADGVLTQKFRANVIVENLTIIAQKPLAVPEDTLWLVQFPNGDIFTRDAALAETFLLGGVERDEPLSVALATAKISNGVLSQC